MSNGTERHGKASAVKKTKKAALRFYVLDDEAARTIDGSKSKTTPRRAAKKKATRKK